MNQPYYLTSPATDYCEAFRNMVSDYIRAGEDIYINLYQPALENFSQYIRALEHYATGRKLPPRENPHSTFWLTDPGGRIYGNIRIRYKALPMYGNIGYDIRPSCRGRGLGTLILRLGLEKARELDLHRIKIACDEKNVPSVRVIERNGGIFMERLYDRKTRLFVKRYYIDL